MATSFDLTTPNGLNGYLTSKSVPHAHITLLTGGTANFVYRVTSPSGHKAIYKHAAPYLHSNHSFAFDPVRMDFENHVLSIVPPLLKQQLPESSVHAVVRYSYDKSQRLLCLEDGGAMDLKKAYTDQKNLDVGKVGAEVGKWLAALHMSTMKTAISLSDSQDLGVNNPVGVAIYRYAYSNLATALADYGHDGEFGKYIDEEFGSRLATENECICHDDFWPGNILVEFRDEEEKQVELAVVDWEMSRRGTSATDVGQFAAEAFLLDRFRGGRGLLAVFLDAYMRAREEGVGDVEVALSREWIRRMAVHWGVHVAFWPTRVEWADRGETQKLVDLGVGVMRVAVEGDWEGLRCSELFRGAGERWEAVWSSL